MKMKKLMIAAAAALWATVGMADVESSNIVGYTSAESGSQNNFVVVPFNSVGCNTADIQSIKISDGGAGTIGWGTETFDIWEGGPAVVEGTSFFYLDPMMDPNMGATDYYWGVDSSVPATFSVPAGQGVVLGLSEGLTITYAGEVASQKIEFTSIAGNNFSGNGFSSPIDIQSIKISDGGAGTIGWGTETFDIWEGVPAVVEGSSFFYLDPMMDPNMEATDYYWGDDSSAPATFSIPAGQGFVLGLAADLDVSIEAPYSL